MGNPGGNYPGRQIILGANPLDQPSFAYFGSGRSPGSQARYASPYIPEENAVRIKPTDTDEPFNAWLHYQAVRIDPASGLLIVSNSQAPVEPLLREYGGTNHHAGFGRAFEDIMRGCGPEEDNPVHEKRTPRIAGMIKNTRDGCEGALGIIAPKDWKSATFQFIRRHFYLAQTYDGNVNYSPFDVYRMPLFFFSGAKTPQQLADELYDMSDYTDPKYGELRVWTVAGMRNGNGPGGWEIARRNRHQVE